MKKFLIILGAIGALVVAAAAVFIATLDLNRYRPQILKQIKQATGKEARIGRISMTWNNGLAARADALALYDAGDAEPDAAVESLMAGLEWAPLLRKEVRVSGIQIVRPQLTVEKLRDGSVVVAGIRPPQSASGKSAAAQSPSAVSAAGAAFSVGSIRIEDATIRYRDLSGPSVLDVTVSQLDAEARNVSLRGPVQFSARAAVFGKAQNLSLEGSLTPPQGASSPGRLENFSLRLDLGTVDLDALSRAVPAVASTGLTRVEGDLQAQIQRLELEPSRMAQAKARVTLQKGAVSLSQVALPLEDVELDAALQGGGAEVSNLSARLAGGTLQFQGSIKDLTGRADSVFRATVRDLSVGKLAKAASPQAPRLEGRLALDFQGRASGLEAQRLTQSLAGQGRLALKDGVLVNSNLLRTIVEKISKIPGVGESAISRIPPQYLAKVNEPSTILRPFEMPFAVQQGRVFFEQMAVPTEMFLIAGSGSVGFDRSLALQAAIVLDPGFSKALQIAAPPTQYLADANGQIAIQAAIEGTPPAVSVRPNLDAALQRVGQQVVSDLLQKKDPKEILSNLLGGPASQQQTPASAEPTQGIPVDPAPQEQAPQQSREEAFVGLLASALKKNE